MICSKKTSNVEKFQPMRQNVLPQKGSRKARGLSNYMRTHRSVQLSCDVINSEQLDHASKTVAVPYQFFLGELYHIKLCSFR